MVAPNTVFVLYDTFCCPAQTVVGPVKVDGTDGVFLIATQRGLLLIHVLSAVTHTSEFWSDDIFKNHL